MFLNLEWIIHSKYPNQKVIVWAANNHVARYNNENKYISMGQYLFSDTSLSNKIYSIGFTSLEGEGGRLWDKNYTINKPKNNSFENWINDSFQYAFIDFTPYNKIFPKANEKFYMRGWRYWDLKKKWNRVFDGIFYIRKMYPCGEITNSRQPNQR
jgi:erythromycin esterase-like protein